MCHGWFKQLLIDGFFWICCQFLLLQIEPQWLSLQTHFLYFCWYVFGLPLQHYHRVLNNMAPCLLLALFLPFIGTWAALPQVPLLRSIWILSQQFSSMWGFALEGVLGWSILRVPRAQVVPVPSRLTSCFPTIGACTAPSQFGCRPPGSLPSSLWGPAGECGLSSQQCLNSTSALPPQ